MESATCEIARGDLLTYFVEVKVGSTQMQIAAHLLNMDETGFCSRSDSTKKRKVGYRTDCAVKPAFREQSGKYVMSWSSGFPSFSDFLQSLDLVIFA
jgi:hypothetical protein